MKTKSLGMRNKKIREMALYAMFIAILAILSFTSLGYISIGGVAITTVHLIVLISAFVLGIKGGLIMGLCFGIFSLARAYAAPTSPFDFAFQNVLVAVLPRLLFGLVSGLFAELVLKIKDKAKLHFAIAGLSGVATILHSCFVLPLLYWQYTRMTEFEAVMEFVNTTPFGVAVGATLVSNSLLEAAEAVVIVPIVCLALYKASGRYSINAKPKKNVMDAYKDKLISSLQKFVNINSVYDAKTVTKAHPYGKGVDEALHFMKDLAISDGFKAEIIDGRVCEISYDVGAKDYVAIMGHADVVPVPGTWKYPPFEAKIVDNVMYGRGTNDDKGPVLAAYYALKAIKDQNKELKHNVKILVGGDEERGSSCMEHYFTTLKKKQPKYGFTPDAEFPLIYGEKAGVGYCYYGDNYKDEVIESFDVGIAVNAIPEKATFNFKKALKLEDKVKEFVSKVNGLSYEYKESKGKTVITFIGKEAHASTPEVGVNPLGYLFKFVGEQNISTLCNHFGKLLDDYDGNHVGIKGEGPKMGKLTMSFDVAKYDGRHYELYLDIRCPIDIETKSVLKTLAKSNLHEGKGHAGEALYLDPNSEFIQSLYNIYVEVSGDHVTKPMTIGGGTYAKHAKNVVAYGMNFLPHEGNGTGNIHSANEGQNLDDLLLGAEIYYKAILKLGNMD